MADVGAGSGWLAWPLSKKVGARGKVLALDINQVAVRMMKEKKRRSPPPHDNLIVIHSHPWNVDIAPLGFQGKVDRAILYQTHFFVQAPLNSWTRSCLRSLYLAMKPGGLVQVNENLGKAEETVKLFRLIGFKVASGPKKLRAPGDYSVLFRR